MQFTPQLMLLMPHLIVAHIVFLIAHHVVFQDHEQDHVAPLLVLLGKVVLVVDFIATHVAPLGLIQVSHRMHEQNRQLALAAHIVAIRNHHQMDELSLDHHSENQKLIVQCPQMCEIEHSNLPSSR